MEDIRDLIIRFAKNNEVISDERVLYQIISELLDKYSLRQYIKRIKIDWIPIYPGKVVEYDYKKSIFHYYTWSIEKLVKGLSLYEFKDQYSKNLFISLMILKYIEHEMEFIRQLNIKSNNTSTFENKLLYLCFKELKKSDDNSIIYLYRKNAMLAPFARLADYYSFKKIMMEYKNESLEVDEYLERMYQENIISYYAYSESSTIKYMYFLLSNNFITKDEYGDFLNDIKSINNEDDIIKYGLRRN